jgi:hypothetical protein
MKIRNGFISNSSSSSFVIDGKHFPNCFALAKHMVNHMYSPDKQLKQKLLASEKYMDPNVSIFFHSLNENTYILKDKKLNVYLVETCHNEDFQLGQFSAELPQEAIDYLKSEYKTEILCEFYCSDVVTGWFWYPEYGVEAKLCYDSDDPDDRLPLSCEVCDSYMVQLKKDNSICCLECRKKK